MNISYFFHSYSVYSESAALWEIIIVNPFCFKGLFANIVRKRLHMMLEEYEASMHNPRSWVLSEASNVTALQEGGTFL